MSKKPQYDTEEQRYPDQHIVESPLVPEMEKSYIEYAMSVIVGRALPDVRDGLKPYTAVFSTPCLRTTCTRIGRTESVQTP